MNITLDQFIDGFERSARELGRVLQEWGALDLELQEAYTDQLSWLIGAREEALAIASDANRFIEISQRLASVTSALASVRVALMANMGIAFEAVVGGTSYTVEFQGEPTSTPMAA